MDAFFTANMAVQHKFFNRLTVKAYVANMFDEEYKESYGYTMPDRTYGASVQYEF
jgi:outer membrane cobalamin receptor